MNRLLYNRLAKRKLDVLRKMIKERKVIESMVKENNELQLKLQLKLKLK